MVKPDSCSALERRFLAPVRGVLIRLYGPIVHVLARLRVPPSLIMLPAPVLAMLFDFTVPRDRLLGFWIWLPSMLVDGMDGALARYSGKTSAFGDLVDRVCDHARETLVVGGLAAAGVVSAFLGSLYPFVYALLNVVLFLCNWHEAPLPLTVNSYWTLYPAIATYLLTGRNCLDGAAALSLVLMGLGIVQGLPLLASGMGG